MSKEHAYAYEAGYRDGATNYELEHCPACKNIADLQEALEENTKLREQIDQLHAQCVSMDGLTASTKIRTVRRENDKLREQMDNLVTLLRNDWDIEASWDGLRHFWYIGLTEDGVLVRDRAYKAEAENAKLRELVRFIMHQCNDGNPMCDGCIEWNDSECVALQRMHELGIEVL